MDIPMKWSASPGTTRPRLAWVLVPTLLLPTLLAPEAVVAQWGRDRGITLELRTSAALPVGDLSRESPGLGAGAGLGAAVALHIPLIPYLAAYGSYDYERFGCGECGAVGLEGGMPEAGFEAGVEWMLPLRLGAVEPWLSAGALFARRLEIPDGGDGFASEAATGWSLAAGVRLPVAPSLMLVPGIRFRSYETRFDFPELGFEPLGAEALEQEMRVASVALEVGLSWEPDQ